MQNFDFTIGDTNFISLVNAQSYESFIDEDWDLISDLIPHVITQQQKGNILMYQMTGEGIEADWRIAITHDSVTVKKYLKKTVNYITVTDGSLYLIDYTNLTMAAQFSDEFIPDQDCAQFKIELENGSYAVSSYLFKDVDNVILIFDDCDMLLVFQPYTDALPYLNQQICWSTF